MRHQPPSYPEYLRDLEEVHKRAADRHTMEVYGWVSNAVWGVFCWLAVGVAGLLVGGLVLDILTNPNWHWASPYGG